jgi:hypothetical protein
MHTITRAFAVLVLVAFLPAAFVSARAADAAPTTVLTGRIACAMCVLRQKDVKTCTNVLVVEKDDGRTVYDLTKNQVTKVWEMQACERGVPVKVTGTVAEQGGRKILTATKIERT